MGTGGRTPAAPGTAAGGSAVTTRTASLAASLPVPEAARRGLLGTHPPPAQGKHPEGRRGIRSTRPAQGKSGTGAGQPKGGGVRLQP